MIKNRLFAFLFRLFAVIISISGLFLGSGFSVGLKRMLFYTQQSNLLAVFLFICLLFYTFLDLFRCGIKGSCCYLPRFSCGCGLVLSYTLVVFWVFLAPFSNGEINLLSLGNIIVHTLTPLLCILDCVLFCKRGKIKKRDIILWPLMPCFYVALSLILGFLGVEFYNLNGVSYHFPYYFMDFEFLGWYAVIFILLLALSFIFFSYLIFILDYRLSKHSLNKTKYN